MDYVSYSSTFYHNYLYNYSEVLPPNSYFKTLTIPNCKTPIKSSLKSLLYIFLVYILLSCTFCRHIVTSRFSTASSLRSLMLINHIDISLCDLWVVAKNSTRLIFQLAKSRIYLWLLIVGWYPRNRGKSTRTNYIHL